MIGSRFFLTTSQRDFILQYFSQVEKENEKSLYFSQRFYSFRELNQEIKQKIKILTLCSLNYISILLP